MEEKEILKLAFLELKKRGIVKTQKDLSKLADVTPASLSLAMNGKMTSRNILLKINSAAGNIFNTSWLYTSEGEMLAKPTPTFGYTTNNGDVGNQNIGTGTQIINPAEDTAGLKATIEKQQKEILDLKIENAKLQGMIEILKQK